jgi:Gpi18-like mannosyltransferase
MSRFRKRHFDHAGTAGAARPAGLDDRRPGSSRWPWLVIIAAALAFRVILLATTSGVLYPGDHDDFVRWGIQATDHGVLSLYDGPPARHDWRVWNRNTKQWIISQRAFDRTCNYPPLSGDLLWLSGIAFKAISTDNRLINTITSHVLFSSWSILGDFITAASCAAIVSLYRSRRAALLAFTLALFLPPLWWDSIVWAQMDSVLLAPAIWMLWAMLRDRWLLAGLLWGLAFALKPQAVLFIPLWGFALFVAKAWWKPILGGLVSLGVLMLTAAPFMLHSGWKCLYHSYWTNLFAEYADKTTLKAFNLWYLHLLITDSLDAQAVWAGLTRNGWGKVFLLTALLTGFAFMLLRWRRDRRGLILWTTLSLLFFVMLPTAVHERYLILALPFLGVAAALTWRLWPPLLMLTVVIMAQMTWPLWLKHQAGSWDYIRQDIVKKYDADRSKAPNQDRMSLPELLGRYEADYQRRRQETLGYEWLLTIAAIGSALATAAVFATMKPGAGNTSPASEGRPSARHISPPRDEHGRSGG